jgi:hypothetical protein
LLIFTLAILRFIRHIFAEFHFTLLSYCFQPFSMIHYQLMFDIAASAFISFPMAFIFIFRPLLPILIIFFRYFDYFQLSLRFLHFDFLRYFTVYFIGFSPLF